LAVYTYNKVFIPVGNNGCPSPGIKLYTETLVVSVDAGSIAHANTFVSRP